MPRSELLTIPDVLDELGISASTFYYWRQVKKAPKCIRLPNGKIRIRRSDLDAWLSGCAEAV